MKRKKVIIIGGGSAGLKAADLLCSHCEVHIYEKGKAVGRKFLVAGNGGFNLTHQMSQVQLKTQFQPKHFLEKALDQYNHESVRKWLSDLGIPTFVGSSRRVFPEAGIKPTQVLQKIKNRLVANQVQFHFFHKFKSLREDSVSFQTDNGVIEVEADFYIFAMGGASWSKTGSDGKWAKVFENFGIKTVPFQSSNCGINVQWDSKFRDQYEGQPLKNIKIKIGEFEVKGEALVTRYGLEGNAIYPSVPAIRTGLEMNGSKATYIHLDLKSNQTEAQLIQKIKGKNIKPKNYGYIFNLNKVSLALIKQFISKETYLNPHLYLAAIKHLAIPIESLRPVEEAISTVGGVSLDTVNSDFSVKTNQQIFIIGEMLNWDAPTGGFLLQGCFSSAYMAAQKILEA